MAHSQDPRYIRTARTLHWLMALLLPILLVLGFYMHDLPFSPEKLKLYAWHKWAGITALVLVVIRLAVRIGNPPPPLPEHMSRAAQAAANAGHLMLYALMLTIPLSGWLMSSAKGFQTVWFGVLPLPDLLNKDKAIGDLLAVMHQSLNIVLAAMLSGHILLTLKHQFINRDNLLLRMLPDVHTSRKG